MPFITLASGDQSGAGSGPLFTVPISALAALVVNTAIGNVSAAQLEQMINPAIIAAETGVPEGTQIEANFSGWTLFGTDYSTFAADKINGYWQQGQFTVNGEPLQGWPEATQVAFGGNNTLTLHYVKGQVWIIYLAVGVALALFAYNLLESLSGGTKWSILGNPPSTSPPSTKGGLSGWWNGLPLWERIGFFAGGLVVAGGLVLFLSERSIAEAGASKSQIVIGG